MNNTNKPTVEELLAALTPNMSLDVRQKLRKEFPALKEALADTALTGEELLDNLQGPATDPYHKNLKVHSWNRETNEQHKVVGFYYGPDGIEIILGEKL